MWKEAVLEYSMGLCENLPEGTEENWEELQLKLMILQSRFKSLPSDFKAEF
jgi:hypothetical protein